VFSDKLPSSEQSGHAIYKTASGKALAGESWSISYGDGSGASGKVYADTVVIGK
jgi:aspergillopepsin I